MIWKSWRQRQLLEKGSRYCGQKHKHTSTMILGKKQQTTKLALKKIQLISRSKMWNTVFRRIKTYLHTLYIGSGMTKLKLCGSFKKYSQNLIASCKSYTASSFKNFGSHASESWDKRIYSAVVRHVDPPISIGVENRKLQEKWLLHGCNSQRGSQRIHIFHVFNVCGADYVHYSNDLQEKGTNYQPPRSKM